jgi:hypothetical protein
MYFLILDQEYLRTYVHLVLIDFRWLFRILCTNPSRIIWGPAYLILLVFLQSAFMLHPNIHLERFKKNQAKSHNSRSPGQDSKRMPPAYELGITLSNYCFFSPLSSWLPSFIASFLPQEGRRSQVTCFIFVWFKTVDGHASLQSVMCSSASTIMMLRARW